MNTNPILTEGEVDDLLHQLVKYIPRELVMVSRREVRSKLERVLAGAQLFSDHGFHMWWQEIAKRNVQIDVSKPPQDPANLVFGIFKHEDGPRVQNMPINIAIDRGYLPLVIGDKEEINLLNYVWNSLVEYLAFVRRYAI